MDEKLPTMADFLVAYATTPDYVAMRDTKTGTWFIQGIASVFAKYACTEDAVSLFGKVNAHIAKRQTRGLGIKQVSSFESTLLKKVYFFPGR
ncbi:cell death protein 3-like [Lingula anatina]|uniref:Cell death protein 3-like n=1 Tax=Lingula anatina TaxID=7574 RepID=A0A1S3HJJ0_LINAN|nr:cell death protein 3-like [Lingula anatina]|eukprot:XP_013385621.1 cell death protein 3-like [Lingula anatina]